jgi:hypothetical protein
LSQVAPHFPRAYGTRDASRVRDVHELRAARRNVSRAHTSTCACAISTTSRVHCRTLVRKSRQRARMQVLGTITSTRTMVECNDREAGNSERNNRQRTCVGASM